MSDKLKVDPLNYVADLESPIDVYIRREILKKETKTDAILKEKLYERTVADQSVDGSWSQLFVRTANNLWDLALLGYEAEAKSVKKALEWLLSIQKHDYRGYARASPISHQETEQRWKLGEKGTRD